jgi:hypothetical protein
MNNNEKTRFYLDKTGFFAESAMIFLVLAAVFRFFGCWGMWENRGEYVMLTLLPIFCCLLMTLCIIFFCRRCFFLSVIPVMLGVVFFVWKALYYPSWVNTVICVLFDLAVAVIYTGTVFGWIPTKWLLVPMFALPFLYRVSVIDIPALSNKAEPVLFSDGMQELSILGILAGMFCVAMALRRRFAAAPVEKKEKETAVAAQPESAPAAPAAQTAPAAPAAAEPAPAEKEPASQPTVIGTTPEMSAILSDEPYTPVLTLDPKPLETGSADAEKTDERKNG